MNIYFLIDRFGNYYCENNEPKSFMSTYEIYQFSKRPDIIEKGFTTIVFRKEK